MGDLNALRTDSARSFSRSAVSSFQLQSVQMVPPSQDPMTIFDVLDTFDKATLERVFREVMDNRSLAPKHLRNQLDEALKGLEVMGRRWDKADARDAAKAVGDKVKRDLKKNKDASARACLQVWRSLRQEWIERARAILIEHGEPVSQQEELPVCWQPVSHEVMNKWIEGILSNLPEITTTYAHFLIAMAAGRCLNPKQNPVPATCTEDCGPGPSGVNANCTTVPWSDLLLCLQRMPPDAAGWDQAEEFTRSVLEIARERIEWRSVASRIKESLAGLQELVKQLCHYDPGWPDVQQWAASDFAGSRNAAELLDVAHSLVMRLKGLLGQQATIAIDKERIDVSTQLAELLDRLSHLRNGGGDHCPPPPLDQVPAEDSFENAEGEDSVVSSQEPNNGVSSEDKRSLDESGHFVCAEPAPHTATPSDSEGSTHTTTEEVRKTPTAAGETLTATNITPDTSSLIDPDGKQPEPEEQLEPHTDKEVRPKEQLLLDLLCQGRCGLVFHAARFLENNGEATPVPSALPRALAFRDSLCNPGGVLSSLHDGFLTIQLWVQEQSSEVTAMLSAAAAMRAALLGGGHLVSELLHSCVRFVRGDGTKQLLHYLSEQADSGLLLTAEQLFAFKQNQASLSMLQQASRNAREWLERNRKPNLTFARASEVLLTWCSPGGVLHEFMQPAAHNQQDVARGVIHSIERYDDLKEIHRLIYDTDESKGHHGDTPIHGEAFKSLVRKFKEAQTLAKEWAAQAVSVHHDRPATSFIAERINKLRTVVEEATKGATRLIEESPAAPIFYESIASLSDFYDPSTPFPSIEPNEALLLGKEWILLGSVSVDRDWQPLLENKQHLWATLTTARDGLLTRRVALAKHLEEGDFQSARRLHEWLTSEEGCQLNSELGEQAIAAGLRKRRLDFQKKLEDAGRSIEAAVAYNFIDADTRSSLTQSLEALQAALDLSEDFRWLEKRFAVALEPLNRIYKNAASAVARRLEEFERLRPSNERYQHIRDLLLKGGFAPVIAADEQLDMLERGERLEGGLLHPDPLERYLSANLPALSKTTFEEFKRCLSQRIDLDGLPPATALSEHHVDTALTAISHWEKLKRCRDAATLNSLKDNVRDILAFLGWETPHVSGFEDLQTLYRSTLTAGLPRCPIPAWGSDAIFGQEGRVRYNLLCATSRIDTRQIVRILEQLPQQEERRPTLVFHFCRLDPPKRRELSHLVRLARLPLLLIDDSAFLRLTLEPPPRLEFLFDLLLTFSYGHPYSTRSGPLPREMFFGRKREIDALMDFRGPCLVFGGRQIGKTALLREVCARFNQSGTKSQAIFLDLEAEAQLFSGQANINRLWQHLARKLRLADIEVPTTDCQGEDILSAVRSWLLADPERRLLVLLDECDHFISFDANENFPRLKLFKSLMEDHAVQSRFKVVFCGLHNVQRMNRDPNSPLVHLGEGVCVGPLLEHGEWHEAHALIERPLHALGYRMESKDPVWAILRKTNYYPKLIQVACDYLLKRVLQPINRNPFNVVSTPPFQVTSTHVDEVLCDKEFRQRIKEDFQRTLELDHRYHVIAYSFAYRAFEDNSTLFSGLPWADILSTAIDWFPDLSSDVDRDHSFRVLLEEMVGLGILKEIGLGRYALRSPQILTLLGSQNDVIAELQRRPLDRYHYDAIHYRDRMLQKDGQLSKHLRAALTHAQLNMLRRSSHGVAVIHGTRALGIDGVPAYLLQVYGEDNCHHIGSESIELFEAFLKKRVDRSYSVPTVVIVDDNVNWSSDWVRAAITRTSNATSKSGFLHIVFLAGLTKTLNWLRLTPAERPQESPRAFYCEICLSSWKRTFLDQWLKDSELAHSKETADDVEKATGCWPSLLQWLGQQAHNVSLQEALDRVDNNLPDFLDSCGFFEILQARDYLELLGQQPIRREDLWLAEELATGGRNKLTEAMIMAHLVREDEGRSGWWHVDPVVLRAIHMHKRGSAIA